MKTSGSLLLAVALVALGTVAWLGFAAHGDDVSVQHESDTPHEEEDTSLPGWAVTGTVVALAGMAFLTRRR